MAAPISPRPAGNCSRSIVVWVGVALVQSTSFGNFEQVSGLTLGGRPVYRLEGNASDTAKFLFFHHVCSQWAIGGALPTASQTAPGTLAASVSCNLNNIALVVFLKSSTSLAACPNQEASWDLTVGGSTSTSYSVAVFAPTAPGAAAVAACSEFIGVRGAEAVQLSSMGRYNMVPGMTLGSRPVYARDYYINRPGRFLFYSPNMANWYIGPSWGSDASAVLRSTGARAAGCPDEASGWEVLESVGTGAWTSSVGITVAAPAGMTSAGEDRTPPALACSWSVFLVAPSLALPSFSLRVPYSYTNDALGEG